MPNILRFFVATSLMILAACGSSSHVAPPPDGSLPTGNQGGVEKVGLPYKIAGRWYYPKVEPNYDKVGLASWYGKQFHGKPTANGEVFNMNALTAAHKTLPLPTFVKVTNLSNRRSIVLRVNDRGPFVDDRIIDVSRRAAQLLGFEQKGVTKVRVQISDENGRIRKRQRRNAEVPTEPAPQRPVVSNPERSLAEQVTAEQHFVQLGAYSDRGNAEERQDAVRDAGIRAYLQEGLTATGLRIWRVRVGPLLTLEKANQVLRQLSRRGFSDARIFSETP